MDTPSLIGFIAAALTTASFLPQVIKSWKTKRTKDISLIMYSIFSFGILLWLTYGIMISSAPVIFANAITFILGASILFLKFKYG